MLYIILGTSLVIMLLFHRLSIFYKVKNVLHNLFWVNRFSDKKNEHVPVIIHFIFLSKILTMVYILFALFFLFSAVVYQNYGLLLTALGHFILFPIMYRLVFYIQVKIFNIE